MRKPIIVYLILGLLIIITLLLFFLFRKRDYTPFTAACHKTVTETLKKNNIGKPDLILHRHKSISKFRYKFTSWEDEYLVDAAVNLGDIKQQIPQAITGSQFRIGEDRTKITKTELSLSLDFYFKKLRLYRLILRKKLIIGKLAIVLDDWGYNIDLLEKTLKLDIPITYAILPHLVYSPEIAKRLYKLNQEFILHLPLEPISVDKQKLEENTIMTTMAAEQIKQIINDDILSLPHIKGLNNHMGSQATQDKRVMGIICDVVKEKNLYLLDSYVTGVSVCAELAKKKGVPFLRRDIFIDNENDINAIKNQLFKAKELAKNNGQTIAIGHARSLTIDAIKEVTAQVKKEGIEFVFASQLLNLSLSLPLGAKNE